MPCVNLCCALVDFKTESFLTNQKMIYGLVLLCVYMYCCMGEKCPFRGQNLGSVLWVSTLRIHLKLHKSGVPGLWRDEGYTQYLYYSFYSISSKKKKKAFYFAICFLSFLTKIQKEACSVSLAFFSIPEVDCLSLVEKGPKCNMVTVCYQVCQTYHAAFLLGSAAASCWYGLAALCMDQSRLTQGRRDLLPALGCEILFISLQLQPYPALQRSSRQPGEFLSARACGVLPNLPPIYAFWDLIFLQWRHSLMMAVRYVRADDWDKTCMQITKEIMVMHCSFLRRS